MKASNHMALNIYPLAFGFLSTGILIINPCSPTPDS
jgi:hypothetical protein